MPPTTYFVILLPVDADLREEVSRLVGLWPRGGLTAGRVPN
jgi:hypothetical protein